MSNYYLCARCEHNPEAPWVGGTVDCKKLGKTGAKVMVDHGHAGGRRPYDEPLDVCSHYERREH